jgi:4-cresol dehydrogenase (hydroxylating)
LAMEIPYPFDAVPPGRALDAAQLRALTKKIGVSAWMGAGAIYGCKEVNGSVRQVIKRLLKGTVDRMIFFDRTLVQRAARIASFLPSGLLRGAQATVQRMRAGHLLLDGYPSTMALPLAYWKRPGTLPESGHNPARDGSGLLWYSPLVPMKPARVRAFVTLAREVMARHQLEPLITLTSLSDAVFDSTMPLLFDGRDPAASERAAACYRDLFAAGRREGFVPYRIPAQHMDLVVDAQRNSWELTRRLKQALDPANILSPGRYAPDRSGDGT